jgi:dTMP kinase
MDVETGLDRADHRNTAKNRFENKGTAFHQRVRSGFLDLAADAPTRFAVVDAGRDPETIHKDIVDLVETRLKAAQVLT